MNIIKISAVLTAALLTGALSATAFAAETLTTTTGSITFRKAIDVTNAAGAGGETLSTERALPTQTVGAADTALTVTNTRSSIAPTGLLLDAAPYGAMLALAAGSGLVFFRKRRRED